MTDNRETHYLRWCGENDRDPESGTSAREYEEELAGGPIEEWWDFMDSASEEARATSHRWEAR